MYLYIVDVLSMDYEMWSAHYSIKIQFQTSCLHFQFTKFKVYNQNHKKYKYLANLASTIPDNRFCDIYKN